MTFFRRVNLRCQSCGEGFCSPSPRDHHSDPCPRCDGTLIFAGQVADKLQRVCDETYVSVGIEQLEKHANRKAA